MTYLVRRYSGGWLMEGKGRNPSEPSTFRDFTTRRPDFHNPTPHDAGKRACK